MIDLLDQIPYSDEGFGKRFLIDQDHIKLIQVALRPGQTVPAHNTNGDVTVLVLKGELAITLNKQHYTARQGMLIPVGYDIPMQIENLSQADATILIIKTPNPATPATQAEARPSPTEDLLQEHELILAVLDAAAFEVHRISQTYKINPGKLKIMLDFFRIFMDRCHHTKEELWLFPALEKHGQARDTGPLAVMLEEHALGRIYLKSAAKALTLVDKGDQISIDEVAGNLGAFVDLLRAHIKKENTILFPLAERLLGTHEQAAIAAGFARVEEDMGPQAHETYRQLALDLARK